MLPPHSYVRVWYLRTGCNNLAHFSSWTLKKGSDFSPSPSRLLVSCWPFPSLLVNWCLWADNAASLIHNSWNTTHPLSLHPSLFHLCLKLPRCLNYCCCADDTASLFFLILGPFYSGFRQGELISASYLLNDWNFVLFANPANLKSFSVYSLFVWWTSSCAWGLRELQHPLLAENGAACAEF